MKKLGRFFIILLFLSISACANEAKIKDIQTAYIYNFAKFIKWPSDVKKSDTFNVCIYGDADFEGKLNELNQRMLGKKKISVLRVHTKEEIQNCQMLILPSVGDSKLDELTAWAKKHHIVTISDTEGYANRGVMINFYQDRKKVRFEINHQEAKNANINISSKLLRVAKVVKNVQN